MNEAKRRRLRACVVAAATAALSLCLPTVAWAHVGLSGSSTAAGSSTLLTFAFSHGCDGSATTEVAIQIPQGINAVAPTINPGWTVRKVMAALANPVTDPHGNQLTERVDQVVYTAKEPVADGLRDTFVLSLTLPADAAGQTLAFPTVQTCETGENAWIELPAAGQDAHDLDSPAPTLVVTAAAEPGQEHEAEAADGDPEHDEAPASDSENAPDVAGPGPLVMVSLVVAVLGLATGSIALFRGRSRTRP